MARPVVCGGEGGPSIDTAASKMMVRIAYELMCALHLVVPYRKDMRLSKLAIKYLSIKWPGSELVEQ